MCLCVVLGLGVTSICASGLENLSVHLVLGTCKYGFHVWSFQQTIKQNQRNHYLVTSRETYACTTCSGYTVGELAGSDRNGLLVGSSSPLVSPVTSAVLVVGMDTVATATASAAGVTNDDVLVEFMSDTGFGPAATKNSTSINKSITSIYPSVHP